MIADLKQIFYKDRTFCGRAFSQLLAKEVVSVFACVTSPPPVQCWVVNMSLVHCDLCAYIIVLVVLSLLLLWLWYVCSRTREVVCLWSPGWLGADYALV
jgi:hypothetical protein